MLVVQQASLNSAAAGDRFLAGTSRQTTVEAGFAKTSTVDCDPYS
jgi:hypothetical protein